MCCNLLYDLLCMFSLVSHMFEYVVHVSVCINMYEEWVHCVCIYVGFRGWCQVSSSISLHFIYSAPLSDPMPPKYCDYRWFLHLPSLGMGTWTLAFTLEQVLHALNILQTLFMFFKLRYDLHLELKCCDCNFDKCTYLYILHSSQSREHFHHL